MSFWTEADLEPKRNFRFKITNDGWAQTNDPVWWWAKTVDKPSFNVTNNEYQLINHKFKYPGIVTWNNIQVTVADFAHAAGPNSGTSLKDELSIIGYERPDQAAMKGIEKSSSSSVANLVIEQLDADGKTVDKWTLKGAFIIAVSNSKLDYSSDEVTEVTLEIAYDYADYE